VVWQFWGRAAEGVLSLTAQGVFYCAQQFTRERIVSNSGCGWSGDSLAAKNGIYRGHDLFHSSIDV